jgi:restriction endonuclease Mrr
MDSLILLGVAVAIWIIYAKLVKPRVATKSPVEISASSKRERMHIQAARDFVISGRKAALAKLHSNDLWATRFRNLTPDTLDKLSGIEFEEWLAGVFRQQGYETETTPTSGDFGVDLILKRPDKTIAIQAKRYAGSVGVAAIQEVSSGRSFYQCDEAWVVTTGVFTAKALTFASRIGVQLKDRQQVLGWLETVEGSNE